MGFFAGLNDEKYDRQYTDRDLTRRIADFFRTQVKQLVFVSIIVIVLAFIGAALPVVVSRMVDMLERTADAASHRGGGRDPDGGWSRLVGTELAEAESDRARGGRCRPRSAHARIPRRRRA